jgi:hypothetical protein
MRLLHTRNLKFQDFYDTAVPSYAILSHRWSGQEVSFQAFRAESVSLEAGSGIGFRKIAKCCQLAADRGFDWVWIDTCCIDQTSSAELTEAINSMFSWYTSAGECYAYLPDVVHEDTSSHSEKDFCNCGLSSSEWFTRGWTLQELIAPKTVRFYDSEWSFMGTKDDLASVIEEITSINAEYMKDYNKASVAARMSWASGRRTSRSEDMAYCLLGLFNVNMPLLYGEGGAKAFLRLQLEILKSSDDESIFTWTSKDAASGMLASSPSSFADCGDIMVKFMKGYGEQRLPYTMTNKGLEYHLPSSSFVRTCGYSEGDTVELALNCWTMQDVVPVPRSGFGPVKGNLKKVMKGGKAKFVQALETKSEKYVMARDIDLLKVKDPAKIPLLATPFFVAIKLRCHGHYWRRVECTEPRFSEDVQSAVGNRGELNNVVTIYVK